MGQDPIVKSIERLLRSVDDFCGALQSGAPPANRGPDSFDSYRKNFTALEVNWSRLESQKGNKDAGQAGGLACAKTWINAFLELKLALRIELLLAAVREQAAVATSGAGLTEEARLDAYRLIMCAGQAAILLLSRSAAAAALLHCSSRKADKRLGLGALTAMSQRGLMRAVADAVNGVFAFAASLRAQDGEPSRPASAIAPSQHGQLWRFTGSITAPLDGLGGSIAVTVGQYAGAVALLAAHLVTAAEDRSAGPPTFDVPPEASSIVDTLAESGLLAAAASAVVDCPYVVGFTYASLTCDVARAMALVAAVRGRLASHGGSEGRRLACGLLRATRHVTVRRLQVALLDRMAVHAGMGPELGAGEEAPVEGGKGRGEKHREAQEQEQRGFDAQERQGPSTRVHAQAPVAGEPEGGPHERPRGMEQQQEQQAHGQEAPARRLGQEQADGWEGSSGAWWFAREEAQQGQILGEEGEEGRAACSKTAGWLEGRHCNIVAATLLDWQAAEEQQLAAAAGVPAAPPPILRARLAARAAEALCRLCRGKGLAGAYAPAPQWEFAIAQPLVQSLLPKWEFADSLPAATARSCLPYWLETAGWAAALLSDATAAAMERLPATVRTRSEHVLSTLAKEGSQAGTLDEVLTHIYQLAAERAYGTSTLSAAAFRDVRCRMFRCGLAASLDHALRLAYSAEDGAQAEVASRLRTVTRLAGLIVYLRLAPLFPPEATADAGSCGDGGRDGEGGRGGLCAGGGGTREATGNEGSGGGGGGIGEAGRSRGGAEAAASGGGSGGPSAGGGQAGASGIMQQAGGGGSSSGAAGAQADAGNQLGLLFTLSKRAAVMARALEAGAEAQGVDGQGQGDEERRQLGLMDVAPVVLEAVHVSLWEAEVEVRRRSQAARGKGAEVGGDAFGATCQAPGAVCVDEAHEALALAARAGSTLAAAYAWQLAADVVGGTTAAAAGPALKLTQRQAIGGHAVLGVLESLSRVCGPPTLLPLAQLLACQPHRLLAAACALPAESESQRQTIGGMIAKRVIALSSHKALSGWVRGWLAAPPSAAAAAAAAVGTSSHISGSGSGRGSDTRSSSNDSDVYAGCLAAPVRWALQSAVGGPYTAEAQALLKLAAGEVVGPKEDTPCCPGGGDGAVGEADGGFQQYAAAVHEIAQKGVDDPSARGAQGPLLPDGSRATDLLEKGELGAGGSDPQPPQLSSVPSWPLPPRLVLPPTRAGALPRLYMCGNPRCSNFGGDCEWALPLKQCGGCRAVRYCGADCQRAHWREGHRAECKALAAGVASV